MTSHETLAVAVKAVTTLERVVYGTLWQMAILPVFGFTTTVPPHLGSGFVDLQLRPALNRLLSSLSNPWR